MKLRIERLYKRDGYTVGKLYIDCVYFCDTLEDTDRGLHCEMTEAEIYERKIFGKTAIPTGVYKVDMNTISPRYKERPFYINNANGGRVPRLLGVKGFLGILIHVGNTATDTDGCILVGENKIKGGVVNSMTTFQRLYQILKQAKCCITIEIV